MCLRNLSKKESVSTICTYIGFSVLDIEVSFKRVE